MSWAAGRHMSALRDVHVWEYTGKWMMHETQIVAAPLFLLWVAQKRLQWCLLRTLRFWEIVAFPFCSHHHNLPLSSPPPGRKIKHSRFMRRRKKNMTGKIGMFIFNASDTVISNMTEVMCNTGEMCKTGYPPLIRVMAIPLNALVPSLWITNINGHFDKSKSIPYPVGGTAADWHLMVL